MMGGLMGHEGCDDEDYDEEVFELGFMPRPRCRRFIFIRWWKA